MDYIANIISKIKNAKKVDKQTVCFPYSILGEAVIETLVRSGFLGSFARKGKRNKIIEATVLFENGAPKISGAKKVSSQAKRVYVGFKEIKPVRNGYGLAIISTPKGVMTGEEAVKAGVGGELLFEIW